MSEWDNLSADEFTMKMWFNKNKEKKPKQYKLRVKQHIFAHFRVYLYKVQRKYLGIFWITIDTNLHMNEANEYINNYCRLLKEKREQKLKANLAKKGRVVTCDCD